MIAAAKASAPPLDQWCIWQSRNLFFRCSFYSYAVNEYEKVLSRWEVMKLCLEPCSLCFFLLKNSLTSTGIQSWTFLSQGMTRFRILTTRRLSMFLLRIPLQAHLTLIRWTLCGTIVSTVLQSCFCCLWRRSIADHPMPRSGHKSGWGVCCRSLRRRLCVRLRNERSRGSVFWRKAKGSWNCPFHFWLSAEA